ncbi:hypothetical protein MPSEU_000879500 [Mayamaea pseudoterrestris]|nr:hypothetical protein MPSEU_000879500 [Mayamaea pseudoterrestris]
MLTNRSSVPSKFWMPQLQLWILVMLVQVLPFIAFCSAASFKRSSHRKLQIINESFKIVKLYWVNPDNGEEILMTNGPHHLLPTATYPSETFVGHIFIAREHECSPPKPKRDEHEATQQQRQQANVEVEQGICRQAWITVSENDDQVATIQADITIDFVDNVIRARRLAQELVQECQEANPIIESPQNISDIDAWFACLETKLSKSLEVDHAEISLHASIRTELGQRSEEYICNDPNAESTPDAGPVIIWTTRELRPDKNQPHDDAAAKLPRRNRTPITRRTVHVKHDRPSSKIHVIENSISHEECLAIEQAAAPFLERAAVADGKGGQELDPSRRALQAGIVVPWNQEMEGNLIARVSRRVYSYANHVLGLNIQEFGQEDLMSIQYFGRGINDTAPDQYQPHCDDFCDGLKHQQAARVATMVMYCSVAEVGGHTNFMNAGVHVKPMIGNGIFFSYIDPAEMVKDSGLTIHSGCPVFEGHKHIVTQWIRLGVDAENPWDAFDSNNLKISEMKAIIGSDYYSSSGDGNDAGKGEVDDDDDDDDGQYDGDFLEGNDEM